MKTTPKRARTLLLTLGLLLSLCACAQKEQTEEAARQHGMSDRTSCGEAMDTQSAQDAFSQEAETSLGWAAGQDELSNDNVWRGISRLCRRTVRGWLCGRLFRVAVGNQRSHAARIPLYRGDRREPHHWQSRTSVRIVPVDGNATVAINRIQWNEKPRPTRSLRFSTDRKPANRCCCLQIWTALHMRRIHRFLSPTAAEISVNGTRRSMQ